MEVKLFIRILSIILLLSLIILLFGWSLILCIYTENKYAYEHSSLIEGLKYFDCISIYGFPNFYICIWDPGSVNKTYTEAVFIKA